MLIKNNNKILKILKNKNSDLLILLFAAEIDSRLGFPSKLTETDLNEQCKDLLPFIAHIKLVKNVSLISVTQKICTPKTIFSSTRTRSLGLDVALTQCLMIFHNK